MGGAFIHLTCSSRYAVVPQVASGILYNCWDAHYRQTTILRFTEDGAALLSGSEDSGVCVWSLSRSATLFKLSMGLCSYGIYADYLMTRCKMSCQHHTAHFRITHFQ